MHGPASPVADTPFDTDDLFGTGVTKSFRISFDRNRYSVPPRLVSQSVVVRGSDDFVRVFLATKEVAVHPRSWGIGEDIEHPTHRLAALATKQRPDTSALPTALEVLGETGRTYARLFAASSRSVQREMVRIVFLVELFGASATKSAIDEVMKTGHVGAEYVEYVLRHKRRLVPAPAPLRLGQPDLDGLSLGEPDLSTYDRLFATPRSSPSASPNAQSSSCSTERDFAIRRPDTAPTRCTTTRAKPRASAPHATNGVIRPRATGWAPGPR